MFMSVQHLFNNKTVKKNAYLVNCESVMKSFSGGYSTLRNGSSSICPRRSILQHKTSKKKKHEYVVKQTFYKNLF